MPAQLWEWAVDRRVGRAPAGVWGSRHRAVEALFRSPAKGACAVSGHGVPVELVDGDSGCLCTWLAALEMSVGCERGVLTWK